MSAARDGLTLPFCPDCGRYCERHTYMIYDAVLMICETCGIMVRFSPTGKRKTWVRDGNEYWLVKAERTVENGD